MSLRAPVEKPGTSPYREHAPKHVCRFDRWKYIPPHNFIGVCTCGELEPPGLLERVLGAVTDWIATMADRGRP